MDSHIRSLLSAAENGKDVKENLAEALELLKQPSTSTSSAGNGDLFPQDLYVLFSELAVKYGAKTAAADMLKRFLAKSPPANQFLCRAYLCQAQLIAPTSSEQFDEFEKSVSYLLKAITMAKETPRYHFLVYNASVLYWNFCRSFLKPSTKQFLTKSLQHVVKALDDIDDKDYEWRATLQIALVQCHLDGNRVQEASTVASQSLSFIRNNYPTKFKELFGIVIKNNLVDPAKLTKDMKNSPELTIYYRLCKLKCALDQRDSSINVIEEIQKILKAVVQGDIPDLPDQSAPASGKKSKRPSTPTRDEDGKSKSPVKTKRSGNPAAQLPPMKKLNMESADKPYLLLDLARIGLEMNLPPVVALCIEQMRTNCVIKDKGFFMEVEFIDAMLSVKLLSVDPYSKEAVRTRLNAVIKCEEAVLNAIRHGDPKIIQVGCITLWNMMLPLLQKNLRKNLRKPLQVIAAALEDIKSLLMILRCQIHMELGKCEEDVEQIEVALQNYKKALTLDDTGIYRERLEMAINRVELRATLYDNPERPEDVATMIIEQAQASDSGSIRMKRSLLIKVGLALAPDVFDIALDSENEAKAMINSEKTQEGMIKQLNARAQQYVKCIAKVPGHLERLGAENDLERRRKHRTWAFLWADLAKIARRQQVWDVCRVACKFCLLYDDERFRLKSSKTSRSKATSRTEEVDERKSRPTTPSTAYQGATLLETDTLRMVSEVHFINAEALIHLLRSEGVELNDEPIPPQDTSKRPKGYIPKKPEEMPDWIAYSEWIKDLNHEVVNSFLRSVAIGKELKETWIVVNAATYYWNYNNHMITQHKHREIHEQLQVILDGLKRAGHEGATTLLVNICVALAQGYIQPWLPEKKAKQPIIPKSRDRDDEDDDDVPAAVKSPKGKKLPANVAAAKARIPEVTISPDAVPDAKKALEVIEYAMKVTNGFNQSDIISLNVRYPMLQMWVLIKQLLQQQINKHLGTDDDSLNEGQNPMTRAQVAVEMLCLSVNGIFEFKDGPSLEEATNMTESCEWTDSLIELQLWTRLAAYARFVKDHSITMRCTAKAISFAAENALQTPKPNKIKTPGTAAPGANTMEERYITEQRMIAYACCMRGETLIENLRGQTSLRHEAIHNFLQSAQFGNNAMSYGLVLAAARNYWNAVLPLIGSPYERQLLKESLKTILECLAYTMDKNMMKAREESERLQKIEAEEPVPATVVPTIVAGTESQAVVPSASKKDLDPAEDDLALQAAMYGVLFQVYADQSDWQEGLKLMDFAISSMPRTKHRLLLFKHRVMVKAKLGHNVSLDIQKFRNESEGQFSQMWHKLALFSKESSDQLTCYQNAIEALMDLENVYQRVDYLMEYSQWLKVNDFPLSDTLDILDWCSDILLNIKQQYESRPGTKGEKRGKMGKSDVSSPRKSKKDTKTDEKKSKDKKEDKKDEKTKKSGKKDGKDTKEKKGSAKKRSSSKQQEKKEPEGSASRKSVKNENNDPNALDINEEDYIPINKKAEIGLKVEPEELKITDLVDQKQLEYLLRINIMAAQIAGQGHDGFINYLYSAYGYLSRMWQLLLGTVGPTLKEIAKQAAAAAEGKASGKKGKNKDKEPASKERPKRKGPLDHLPLTIEEWSLFDAPDEVIEAAGHSSMKSAAITVNTITKPTLLLYSLDTLNDYLRTTGYNHLCLPLLAFQDLLTRSLCKSQSFNILVHLRATEVCTELNLMEGVKFHEKLVSQISPVDLDLASSWIDMAIFKEKQHQVEQEEQRIQASLKAMLEDEKIGADGMLPTKLAKPKQDESESETPHLGQKVSSLMLRDVWTSTAKVLIRLGYYQPARQYLYAALQSSQEFDDKIQQSKILNLLAELSYMECQYRQCINFLMESHKIVGTSDEYYWFNTYNLMSDCQLEDSTVKHYKQKACNTISDTLLMFNNVFKNRPNEITSNNYITCMLESKYYRVRARMNMEHAKMVLKPRFMKLATNSLEKWAETADRMLECNFTREAARNYREIGELWCDMAVHAYEDSSVQHDLLIKAYTVLNKACQISDELSYQTTSSMLPADLAKLSLPVQREYIQIQLCMIKCLLQIFETYIEEKKRDHELEKSKDHIQKVVESVVRTTPIYTDSEKDWMYMTEQVAQLVISMITSCYHMCAGIPLLTAESLLYGGRCLRLLSLYTNMDSPDGWAVDSQMVFKLIQTLAAAEEAAVVISEEPAEYDHVNKDSKDYIRNATEMQTIVEKEEESTSQLAQASEILGQAIQICLQNSMIKTARLVAYELVECYGQFDAAFSSQYLALYQSCSASLELRNLLRACYRDPMVSRKAAMLKLYEKLEENSITTNLTTGQLYQQIRNLLSDGQSWKNMQISPNHLELMRDFPNNWQLVILQHSPCGRFLYGAVLDKPEAAAKKQDKSKQGSTIPISKAKIMKCAVKSVDMKSLIEAMKDHKFEVMTTLLKQEYQRTIVKQQERMLESMGEEAQPLDDLTLEEDEEELQGQFDKISAGLEKYVQPLSTLLDVDIRLTLAQQIQKDPRLGRRVSKQLNRPGTSSTVNPDGKKEKSIPVEVIDTTVVLADYSLLELPLESLDMFEIDSILSMSRDISLQLLYNRFHQEQLTPEEQKALLAAKNAIPPRIPGARDANKKQAKYIPLDRPIPPSCTAVDTNNFKYLVDPYGDLVEDDDDSPMKIFDNMYKKYEQQFTTRWLGITHLDHEPSVAEWETYMSESSGFLFYGFEHLLSYISPAKLVSLDLPDCMMCLLFDLSQTSKSFSRRSINNVLKHQSELSLETHLCTALMLSLSGVKCVVANQWHCTLADNSTNIQHLIQDVLEKGKTSGIAGRLINHPAQRAAIEQAEKEEQERLLHEKEMTQKADKSGAAEEPIEEAPVDPEPQPESEPQEEQEKRKLRRWYNMVTYGVPNLIVTQI